VFCLKLTIAILIFLFNKVSVEVNCQRIALSETNAFSDIFLAYINQDESLKGFHNHFPKIENFDKYIKERSFTASARKTLVESLTKQYKHLENAPDFSNLLDEKTFTVTTGHQLNIFTGPLYIIYKIVTTIKLARELKVTYPDYNFVPIYWMASEDHDFEEIASFYLNGHKHSWKTSQTGAVGHMSSQELKELLAPFSEEFSVFKDAYLNNETLADAVRQYMHDLFGAEGLVTLDADDRALKAEFTDVMRDDIFNQSAADQVRKTSEKIEELGFKTQIQPREINFFYLENGIRERIIEENGAFLINNTGTRLTKSTIEELIQNEPEKFSPNVVLRPLYQEVILPNLAYIGGPSEVPYWLQLKGVFSHYKVDFPALIPRNFAVVINTSTKQKMEKLGVTPEELFNDDITLRRALVARQSTNSLTLAEEREQVTYLFKGIAQKGLAIDPTLEATVEAAHTRINKMMIQLEKRLVRGEERNFESSVEQLRNLKGRLFPNGVPQERRANLMDFYLNDSDFIKRLFVAFDPLDFRFNLLFV
jgi:bacillithiol biosynthesis cysteine-adding enzyme BshC